jgi:hypothetical protein
MITVAVTLDLDTFCLCKWELSIDDDQVTVSRVQENIEGRIPASDRY